MTFDDITGDGRLWAVKYEGEDENALFQLFDQWSDVAWLRIYALKLSKGVYVVTGGAIKLTATMQERSHTLMELQKMEKVRNFLIEEGIVDDDSFIEYVS